MGSRALQDRASRGRRILVTTGLGVLPSRVRCLLHVGKRRLLCQPRAQTPRDRLMALFSASEAEDWVWFENLLAYDNARLPQALIQTGLTTHTPTYVEVGL